jgi:RHS repeat-associated protein
MSLLSGTVDAVELPAPPVSPAPVIGYDYDSQENLSKVIQALGTLNLTTQITYDVVGRSKDVIDPKLGKTQFSYDASDRTVKVTDPRSLVTQYVRNGLGDVKQVISPDTGTATLTHDVAGNVATKIDSRGVLATYSYDVLNRLASIVYSQSGQSSLSYGWIYDMTGAGYANGIGRLGRIDYPSGNSQFSYDPQGRVTQAVQNVNAASGANAAVVTTTVRYGYDAAGQLASITYPSGRVLTFMYADGMPTALGLAGEAASPPATLMSRIKWQAFGDRKSWQLQFNSGPQTYEHLRDLSSRLVRYPLGQVVRDLTYDAASRIVKYQHYDAMTGAAQVVLDQAFRYDENGMLTSAASYSTIRSFAYDASGNRTSLTLSGSIIGYTTPTTSNRLSSTSNPARNFVYDNAGNITSDSGSGSGSHTATYDLSGRMASLTKVGITTTYSHDNLGQRVRKFSSSGTGSTVIFVYNPSGQLLGEYDSTGKALREYVWLGAIPVAVFIPDPANAINPPLVNYIHTDHLGTPQVVVDANNAVRWRWMAEPFGTSGPDTNPSGLGEFTFNLRMPGQYADAESGLFYNYSRNYDPTIGRYVQSDPIGLEGGINTYAYVGGDPVSNIDPTGLKTFNECETAGFFGEAQTQSLQQAFVNHRGGGKYDFAYSPNRGDTWTIAGRTYNSNEFGNVLAGYSGGFMFGEDGGGLIVGAAGWAANLGDNGLGGDGDASSRPYIDLGTRLGARDKREGRFGGVCSCGGSK